jgi:hypothetical protein
MRVQTGYQRLLQNIPQYVRTAIKPVRLTIGTDELSKNKPSARVTCDGPDQARRHRAFRKCLRKADHDLENLNLPMCLGTWSYATAPAATG